MTSHILNISKKSQKNAWGGDQSPPYIYINYIIIKFCMTFKIMIIFIFCHQDVLIFNKKLKIKTQPLNIFNFLLKSIF